MTILEENVKKYYQSGYNCSETLLHACNETYQLDISEEDMKIVGLNNNEILPVVRK